MEFSTDGVDYSYVPTPDVDGFDSAVRHIRIDPSGIFPGRPTATRKAPDLRIGVRVQ